MANQSYDASPRRKTHVVGGKRFTKKLFYALRIFETWLRLSALYPNHDITSIVVFTGNYKYEDVDLYLNESKDCWLNFEYTKFYLVNYSLDDLKNYQLFLSPFIYVAKEAALVDRKSAKEHLIAAKRVIAEVVKVEESTEKQNRLYILIYFFKLNRKEIKNVLSKALFMAIYNDEILKDDLEKSYRELGREEGLEEGLELGLEKVAAAMLRALKFSRPEISELCGLSEDRLNSLSQELGLG
ncbi:MAG: hypothetical protein LBE01_03645, partial [Deltaproteobacteria bacterium]|nr:hypothetical protein [Deltaproteobacteria bacterium]